MPNFFYIQDYSNALSSDPNNAILLTRLGSAYASVGDMDHAMRDVSQAITLNGQFVEGYLSRAAIYDAQGDWEHYLADYKQALALKPDDALIYYERAQAYQTINDPASALADYQHAIELDPQEALIYGGLAEILNTLGKFHEALTNADQTVKLDTCLEGQMESVRGMAAFQTGVFQAALKHFTLGIETNPLDYMNYLFRAVTDSVLGDSESAKQDYT